MPTPTEDFQLAIETIRCQILKQCPTPAELGCEHNYLELLRCIEAIYNSYQAEYATGERKSQLINELQFENRNLKAGLPYEPKTEVPEVQGAPGGVERDQPV